MENVINNDIQQQLEWMRAQMETQAAQLQQLRSVTRDNTSTSVLFEVAPEIAEGIPPHLQLTPPDVAERKRILKRYPKVDLPAVLRDDNGLAAQAIGPDAHAKKWIIERLPGIQRDNLEVVRVAACAWQQAAHTAQNDAAAGFAILVNGMRDIIALACDSAQRAAQTQLKQTFEAAGQSGAYALLDLSPNTHLIDFADANILQPAHLDALTDAKTYRTTIESSRKKPAHDHGRGGKGGRGGGHYNHGKGGGKGGGRGKGGKGQGNGHQQMLQSPDP